MEQANTIEPLKGKFPSICRSCDYARRPASESNLKKGFVGCCMRVIRHPNKDIEEIGEAEVIGEGWVDLKSKPKLGKGSGMITNFQLLTKGVKHCNLHSEIDE